MKKDLVSEIIVKENKIGILKVGNINYISLTDLVRYQNERLKILNNSAKRQIEVLKNNQSMIELEKLQNEINDLI